MTTYTATHGEHEAPTEAHCGRIITMAGDRLVTKSDTNGEHWHTIAHDVQVTRDGKPCRLDDLKLGVNVRVFTRHDDETTAIGIECVPRD